MSTKQKSQPEGLRSISMWIYPSAFIIRSFVLNLMRMGEQKAMVIGFFSTVEAYDPLTDKWTKKADMPTARMFLSTSAVNGKIYAIGGVGPGDAILSIVEEYDTGFTSKGINTEGKLPTTWGRMKVK